MISFKIQSTRLPLNLKSIRPVVLYHIITYDLRPDFLQNPPKEAADNNFVTRRIIQGIKQWLAECLLRVFMR